VAKPCRVHWYDFDTGERIPVETVKRKLGVIYTGHERTRTGKRRVQKTSYEAVKYQVCKDDRFSVGRYIGIRAGSTIERTWKSLIPHLKKNR